MSCPDCFSGHVHEDTTPRGTVTTLHGLNTYVTEPTSIESPIKGIIIIIPDAFGWEFVNNRILADRYADKGGYKVYLPEFMNGMFTPDHQCSRGDNEAMRPAMRDSVLNVYITCSGHAAPVWTLNTLSAIMKTSSIMDWITKP